MARETNIYMAGNARIKQAVAISRGNADQNPFRISTVEISPNFTNGKYFIKKTILIVAKSANKKTSIFNNVNRSFFIIYQPKTKVQRPKKLSSLVLRPSSLYIIISCSENLTADSHHCRAFFNSNRIVV